MTPERFARLRQVLQRRQPDLTVLMERLHKPHNFSAVLRSADAVGVFEAHAVAPRGGIPTYDKTSGSAYKWVGLRVHLDTNTALAFLKSRGMTVYAAHLSPESVDYREVDYTRSSVVLLGTEWSGVSETASLGADVHVHVPMRGMVGSLNVSVAAAVILFEAERQREAAGLYGENRLEPEIFEQTLFTWAYPRLARRYVAQGHPFPKLGPYGELLR